MYENVRTPTRRRDGMLLIWILIAVFLLIALAAPVAWGAHLQLKYREFVNDLTESVLYAKGHSCLYAVSGDERTLVPDSRASRIYDIILTVGAGKPQKELPDGDGVLLDFGNGSSLHFWPTEIKELDPEANEGVFISYTDPAGETYAYDTASLTYDVLYAQVFPD